MVNPLSNPWYLIPPLVGVAISFSLIILVLRKVHRSSVHRIFSLLLLSSALWSIFIFTMRASPDMQHALFWDTAVVPAGTALPVFYYHFTSIYTRRTNMKLLWGAYLFLFSTFVLASLGLVISDMTLESYGYCPQFYPTMYLISLGGIFFLIMGLRNLIKGLGIATRHEDRTRLSYMIAAVVFPFLGGIIDLFPSPPPVGMLGNILFCLVTAIAILKYHLLDIRLIIRKGLAYLLMSTAVALPYVGILILLNHVFGTQLIPVWVYLLILIMLALGLQSLWAQVQHRVDRWFYRQRYDFLRELEDFSQKAHDIRDLNQLSSSLVILVSRALQTSSVHLLLSSGSGGFSTVCSAGAVTSQIFVESSSPLLRWLQSNEGILDSKAIETVPQLQSLTAKEAGELKKVRAKLFIPLKTKEKEMVGIIILGEKLSEQPYSMEEEKLLMMIASQIAVNLENAYLYVLEKEERARLEALDEQRTGFFMAVSHELKTPLTSIKLCSEMLFGEINTSPRSALGELLKNLILSTKDLEKRVNDLLDFIKLQTASLEFQPSLENANAVLENVMASMSVLVSAKEQSLSAEIPSSLPLVMIDRRRFEQIVLNLVSNAVKYTPTGGKIKLRAEVRDSDLVVAVSDNGPGIPSDEQELVFKPYYHVRRQPGYSLGLGLSIAKAAVELHGGKIWVNSQPGQGTTFYFTVPLVGSSQDKRIDFTPLVTKH